MSGQHDESARERFFGGGMRQLEGLANNVLGTRGPGDKPAGETAGGASATTQASKDITFFLANEEIAKLAEEIAAWENPYDVYIWLWAEVEEKLASAYTITTKEGGIDVRMDPSRLVPDPDPEIVSKRARELAAGKPNLHHVHWFSAESRLILERAKAAR